MVLQTKRILLVAGVPPCTNYSGGLFLDAIVGTGGTLAGAFVVQNRVVTPIMRESALEAYPVRTVVRPDEWYASSEAEEDVRRSERRRLDIHVPAYKKQLMAFAREIEATDIWFVLEGQTLIGLAHSLLDDVHIPLRIQVMDPPGWWMRAHNIDDETARDVLRMFGELVERASGCATASFAMTEAYQNRYGRPCVTVIPSLDPSIARRPSEMNPGRSLKVGFAGQTYANEEFAQLVLAMDGLRRSQRYDVVELHAFTLSLLPNDHDGMIRMRGWAEQERLIDALSEMDLLYCPYWFAENMREEARLSFPSKLTTYLAAGRPVLFHGRSDSSPGQFLRGNAAAFFCFRPDAPALRQSIERAMAQPDLYLETAANGTEAFSKHLTNDRLRRSFEMFMSADDAAPRPLRHPPSRPVGAGQRAAEPAVSASGGLSAVAG